MYYNVEELTNLKYVKVAYTDYNDEMHEVCAEVKFIGNALISVYFKQSKHLYLNCPQDVIVKFITQNDMYIATAVLQEVKHVDNTIYFTLRPPQKMEKQVNKRKYSRINLDRMCVLVVTDEKGNNTTYLSRTVNLSASGVLIRDLETMSKDKPIRAEFSKYDCFHLIYPLEHDLVFKLFSRFVRHDFINDSDRYAFHYLSVKPETVVK